MALVPDPRWWSGSGYSLPEVTATMSSFSPTDAAFSVFPLLKRYPRFVGLVVAISVPIGIISSVLFSMGLGDAFAAYSERVARDPNLQLEDLSAIWALVNVPLAALMLLFTLVSSAMLTALMLRKTVLNEDPAGVGLRFGPLEIRLIQANLLIFLGAFLASMVVFMVVGFLAAIAGEGPSGALLAVTVVPVALTMLVVFAIGRLGLFGVAAAATGTVGLRAAWEISRTTFWSIVGALLLWSVAAIVMSLVFQAVVSLVLGLSGDAAAGIGSPQALVASGLIAGFGGFTQLGTVCVGAFAWHQMKANTSYPGPGPA